MKIRHILADLIGCAALFGALYGGLLIAHGAGF